MGKAGILVPTLYMEKLMLERIKDDLCTVAQLINGMRV